MNGEKAKIVWNRGFDERRGQSLFATTLKTALRDPEICSYGGGDGGGNPGDSRNGRWAASSLK